MNIAHGTRAPEAAKAAPLLPGDGGAPPAEDARAIYTALHRGLSTLGPDEGVIFGILAERTPEELADVARVYRERFGEVLEKRLRRDLCPSDLRRAHALFAGDRVQRMVERLRAATTGMLGRNAGALVAALAAVPPKLLDDVRRRFACYFGPLELAVRRCVSGTVRDGALLLLHGDRTAAMAVLGADFAMAF